MVIAYLIGKIGIRGALLLGRVGLAAAVAAMENDVKNIEVKIPLPELPEPEFPWEDDHNKAFDKLRADVRRNFARRVREDVGRVIHDVDFHDS